MEEIRFGTDGWRAILADQFTFDNVRQIAQAVSEYLIAKNQTSAGIAVSYDTRFLSSTFARHFAEVVASNDIPVLLSANYTPTPVLSFAVKNYGLSAGIMVTASHNPYFYNGIKFKGPYGGPVMNDVTSQIESLLGFHKSASHPELIQRNIQHIDFFPEYQQQIEKFIKFESLAEFREGLIVDPMAGAGCGFIDKLLQTSGLHFESIFSYPDPYFGNRLPEPIPKNLEVLSRTVRNKKASLGLALDGDADRFGAVDGSGEFVELHDVMPLFLEHLIKSKKLSGKVVRTTSLATTVDMLARELKCEVLEVPVGFKNVTERMIGDDVLIGGEESGGFGYKGHLPERDGILSVLLLLELLGEQQTDIRELVAHLREKYGPFSYERIDRYHDIEDLHRRLQQLRKNPPDQIAGVTVSKVNLIDGLKLYFGENTWMLIRVSQTEPLVRIYVAAPDRNLVKKILHSGLKLMTGKK
ncbi:MAG: phosphoglucomutase/phosphomannomutase family protein [Calditrichaeota bacterium]|nr:phosphoglucomutase/phosphomannomutase family protein [Calditrichota bacterium]RQW07287.1 MAG: phosphoglucomutase/phosphomannomutase family protein [Calditrichota bacterium]